MFDKADKVYFIFNNCCFHTTSIVLMLDHCTYSCSPSLDITTIATVTIATESETNANENITQTPPSCYTQLYITSTQATDDVVTDQTCHPQHAETYYYN